MLKIPVIIAVSILALAALVYWFVPQPTSQDSAKNGTGRVVLAHDRQGSFLGIQQNFRIQDPFAHRSLRPTNFPQTAKAGQYIAYSYQTVDVVGVGKWDVYVKLLSVFTTATK